MTITSASPYSGLKKIEEDLSILDAWGFIHSNANAWLNVPAGNTQSSDRQMLDKSIRIEDLGLGKIIGKQWQSLCEGVGMTVYGAVALSWCEGTKIEDVWEGWEASGFPLLAKPEYERPARFINKELLPKTNSLKAITEAADNKSLPIRAMIVALEDEPLDFDFSDDQLRGASPQVAAFLKKKAEAQGGIDPALIAHWAQQIEGTEYA